MPRASRATKRGTRKLSEVAKHLAVPRDIASTGWPDVRATCRDKLGVTFDDWQDGTGRLILAKRADGSLAAAIDGVGLSVCRQVGKTYLVGATVFALCVNMPGLLVIWSAHHSRTHAETFLAMQGFAKRQRVAAHVQQVYTGSGDEEIRFHNGSRILFGARERGFGRGIPGVDVLIFDEAQILSDRAMSNMLATLNTSKFGLQLYIGTPPKPEDMSEAFTRMRNEALAGTLHDGAWVELGADDDADDDDRAQWRKANPSYPGRTPLQSMLRLKRKLTEADWRREGLGIWSRIATSQRVIDPDAWTRRGAERIAADTPPTALAVDQWYDGTTAVGAAWRTPENGWHVEVLAMDYVHDNASVVDLLQQWAGKRITVAVAGDSPAAAMIGDLRSRGIKVNVLSVGDQAKACVGWLTDLSAQRLTYKPEPQLDTAAEGARKALIGTSGLWRWGRADPSVNLTPLTVITWARFAATLTKRRTRTGESVFR